jgi:hypothetical protein
MKYFTPDMFVRLNSGDNAVARRAESEWEKAAARYRTCFRRIAPELPEELRRFCTELDPHDAEIIGLTKRGAPSPRRRSAELFARQRNKLLILTYSLAEKPTMEMPLESSVFYNEQPIWLYDEIAVVRPGVFSHEILISNGYVYRFVFKEFEYDEFQIVHPVRERTRATA